MFRSHPTADTLAFLSATNGAGAGEVYLILNTNLAGLGKLGVLFACPKGATFLPGAREVVNASFVPKAFGVTALALTDQLVNRCVSSALAEDLPVSYLDGTVTVSTPRPPPLAITRAGAGVLLGWPAWGADFTLEMSSGLTGVWTNAPGPVETNGSQVNVLVPSLGLGAFFRLQR